MKSKRNITLLPILAVAIALCTVHAPSADAAITKLKALESGAAHVWKITRKVSKRRNRCSKAIEAGDLPWTVDCSANPTTILGGSGTGDLETDEKIAQAYSQGNGTFLGLAGKGFLPSDLGLDSLCSPASDVWTEVLVCARQLASDASMDIFDLHFDPTVRSVSATEAGCRFRLGRRYATLFRTALRNRVKCFKKSGLLGDGNFAEFFDCRSPALPPGYGTPDTGQPNTDARIASARAAFTSIVHEACPGQLNPLGFLSPFSDPTGGFLAAEDLGQIARDRVLDHADRLLDGLYPGIAHCGDNITQAPETCDDGDFDSCDGCDSNCTLTASGCGNGVACAPEECDDGNAIPGDGCDNCVLEYCGDGSVQAGIGEQCDDGGNVGGDGCDPNCQAE